MMIAAGGVCNIPQDLLAEEATMQRIPLSTQACEVVHRQTRLVKLRAPASAIPWILASARVHQNIEWVRSWVENENPDLAAALDFEWMNAKRIWQLRQGQKGHRPVQNTWTDVCSWVYRLKRWGSVTDGNITIFPEADATHMDLLSGATWSVLEHSLTKWT